MPAGATTVLPGGDRTTVLPGREEPGPDATHVAPAPGGPGSTRPAPRRAAPLPPNRRRFVWPLMIAALLIVAGALVLARKPKTTVPELRGLSRGGVSARAGRHEPEARLRAPLLLEHAAQRRDLSGSRARCTGRRGLDGPRHAQRRACAGRGAAAQGQGTSRPRATRSTRSVCAPASASARHPGTPPGQCSSSRRRRPPRRCRDVGAPDRAARAESGTRSRTSRPRTRASPCRSGSAASGGASPTGWPTRGVASCSSSASARRRTIGGFPNEQQGRRLELDEGSGQDARVRGERRRLPGDRRPGDDSARWSMSVQDFY